MTGKEKKRFFGFLLAISALGVFLRLYGITGQPLSMDEVQTAFTALNYVESGQFGPIMPYHPNLRNLLVHASMRVFGGNVFGLRAFSLLFGALGVPLLGLMVLRITKKPVAGLFAAFFLAVDPVHIMFSRQAIQEVHTAFFFMLGTLLAVTAVDGQSSGDKREAMLLPLSGAVFGLGLASKAHALFPLLVCLGYLAQRSARGRVGVSVWALRAVSLTLMPLAVYILTYYPWFGRGYGVGDWVFMQKSLFSWMATHTGNPMDSLVDTRAWQWFVRPFMGYGNFSLVDGKHFVTVAMGNPLVWMAVLPSALFATYRSAKGGLLGGWLLLALFFASYLPLALTTRPIWVMSSIAVTPFAYGLVGLVACWFRERFGRVAIGAYVAAVMVVSILLYPIAIGKAWDYEFLRPIIKRHNPHQ